VTRPIISKRQFALEHKHNITTNEQTPERTVTQRHKYICRLKTKITYLHTCTSATSHVSVTSHIQYHGQLSSRSILANTSHTPFVSGLATIGHDLPNETPAGRDIRYLALANDKNALISSRTVRLYPVNYLM